MVFHPSGHDITDQDLLARVRAGDVDAYATLWSRHVGAARGLALRIAPHDDVDDLISESCARILTAIQGGGGPDSSFRSYLYSTVRRINIDLGRRYRSRVDLTDDENTLDNPDGHSSEDHVIERDQQQTAWDAWRSLDDDSRDLLWKLVVDEATPAQLAAAAGVSANAIASRGKRAREKLRQAFLTQTVATSPDEVCRRIRQDMGAHVRGVLASAPTLRLEEHVRDCDRCRLAWLEAVDLEATIRLRIAPIIAPAGTTLAAATYGAVAHETGSTQRTVLSVPNAVAAAAAVVLAAGIIVALRDPAPASDITAPARKPDATISRVTPPAAAATSTTAPVRAQPAMTAATASSTSPAARAADQRSARLSRPTGRTVTTRHATVHPATWTPTAPGAAVPVSTEAPTTPRATANPYRTASTISATSSPPVTTSAPTTVAAPVMREFRFAPATDSFYTASIQVSDGWLITSVVDEHPDGPHEHLGTPDRSFTHVLTPGPLSVTVTQTPGRTTPGVLEVHFSDLLGHPVDGGGIFTV